MRTPSTLAGLLVLMGSAQAAGNCDTIRDQIDAKIRASGVSRYTLTVVDAGASAPGRNVGSCERGSRKILYVPDGKAASQGGAGALLTECKDGTVSRGGNCGKQP